jgi:hypothetical protein
VRLVFSDVDETIAPLHAPAEAAMLDELSSYLRQGGRLYLVSGNDLERVRSGITDRIEPRLRAGVLIAPLNGAEVWGFTPTGELRDAPFVTRYNGAFTTEVQRSWRRVTAQLVAEFGLRAHHARPPREFQRDVGDDPRDVMFDDRGAQICFEFVNGRDLSAGQLAKLPFRVPTVCGRADLRVPVLARASKLLTDAGLRVTARPAGLFALNMAIEGVSKASAVTDVLGSSAILASIGLTTADLAVPEALEVWGDNFSPMNGGIDLDMSEALPSRARSIDFRDEDRAELPGHLNLVLWDGAHRLQDGLLEYLQSRHGRRSEGGPYS